MRGRPPVRIYVLFAVWAFWTKKVAYSNYCKCTYVCVCVRYWKWLQRIKGCILFFLFCFVSHVSACNCVCVFSFLSACCCCLLGVLIFLSSTVDGWHCSLYSHRCYTQMTAVFIPISLWILQCETDNEAKATKTTTKLSEILQKNWIIALCGVFVILCKAAFCHTVVLTVSLSVWHLDSIDCHRWCPSALNFVLRFYLFCGLQPKWWTISRNIFFVVVELD